MVLARAQLALTLAISGIVLACEPKLVVGEKLCPVTGDAMTIPLATDSVQVGWQSGFETDFCDFTSSGGYCVEDRLAQNRIVSSPKPHGGQYAAAFTVDSTDGAGYQSRCVRQGALPTDAYYGAWFYLPKIVPNFWGWNLFHFRGASAAKVNLDLPGGEDQAPSDVHSLWDVTVGNVSNGKAYAFIFNFANNTQSPPLGSQVTQVPVGEWFHLEFRFKRAANATGEVTLYQNGKQLADLKNLVTDDTDWGRWYIGDFSESLAPPDSTIYVDDVTISDMLAVVP